MRMPSYLNLWRRRKMTGIEYSLLKAEPPRLFVVAKQERHSEHKVSLLECYYVLDGSIYMAPSLYTLLSHRMVYDVHDMLIVNPLRFPACIT